MADMPGATPNKAVQSALSQLLAAEEPLLLRLAEQARQRRRVGVPAASSITPFHHEGY